METMITVKAESYFEAVCGKKAVFVSTMIYGQVRVGVISATSYVPNRVTLGKSFSTIQQAIENYKSAEVKNALAAIQNEMCQA